MSTVRGRRRRARARRPREEHKDNKDGLWVITILRHHPSLGKEDF